MTLCINDSELYNIQYNGNQHVNKNKALSITTVRTYCRHAHCHFASVAFYYFSECFYAECHYAECRCAKPDSERLSAVKNNYKKTQYWFQLKSILNFNLVIQVLKSDFWVHSQLCLEHQLLLTFLSPGYNFLCK